MTITELCFQWQRSYYDAIIRTNKSLEKIREYIVNNPRQWNHNPENTKNDVGPFKGAGASKYQFRVEIRQAEEQIRQDQVIPWSEIKQRYCL